MEMVGNPDQQLLETSNSSSSSSSSITCQQGSNISNQPLQPLQQEVGVERRCIEEMTKNDKKVSGCDGEMTKNEKKVSGVNTKIDGISCEMIVESKIDGQSVVQNEVMSVKPFLDPKTYKN